MCCMYMVILLENNLYKVYNKMKLKSTERFSKMADNSKKKEFSIKDTFEQMEKEKDSKYRKRQKYGEESIGVSLLQVFGIAFVGAICGGVVFVACRWWFSIFSVLFFIINGLAAYIFSKEFVKTENKIKGRLAMVFIADILSVFITLTAIYMLIPAYVDERINKGIGAMQALVHFLFDGMMANMIWIEGILFSFLGILLGWLITKGSGKKSGKKK